MTKLLGSCQIRAKGEITIPKTVRKYLKLKEGDKLVILLEDSNILIKREKISYEDFDIKNE